MKEGLLNKILIGIICFLLGVIAVVSVIGLTAKTAAGKNTYIDDPEPTAKEISSLNKHSDEKLAAYTGINRIRIVTLAEENDENGCPMVLTPWFTYPETNIELYEELSKKRILITGIITNYFSQKTKSELLSANEDKIKADLLKEINGQLVLGKIIKIYFTDYIFLE